MNNEDILLKIKQKNPWWQSARLIEEDEKLSELALLTYPYTFSELKNLDIFEPGVYTIRGIRQIGKSTIIKQIIKRLLSEEKVEPRSIFYFSCESIHEHGELYKVIQTFLSEISPSKKNFIFVDEITFVDEWQRAIKELADDGEISKSTVILTGSDMIDLKRSSELMPGRRGKASVYDINLMSLGFREFLRLLEPELLDMKTADALKNRDKFQKYFDHYLLCGGIPKVINEYFLGDRHFLPSYIYEMYRSWIIGDILKAGKSEQIFESIVSYLMKTLTKPVSWYKIGKESNLVSHAAAMDYVELLERMFVSIILEMIDPNSKLPVFRKNKKIFFSDPLIHDALRTLVDGFSEESWSYSKRWIDDPQNLSYKVEQVAISNYSRKNKHVFYWAGDKEIDIVVKLSDRELEFCEVKYQNNVSAREFLWFSKVFPKSGLTVLTKRDYEIFENIKCIPICIALALNLS